MALHRPRRIEIPPVMPYTEHVVIPGTLFAVRRWKSNAMIGCLSAIVSPEKISVPTCLSSKPHALATICLWGLSSNFRTSRTAAVPQMRSFFVDGGVVTSVATNHLRWMWVFNAMYESFQGFALLCCASCRATALKIESICRRRTG